MTEDEIRDTLQDIQDIAWDADPSPIAAALAEALRRIPGCARSRAGGTSLARLIQP